MRQAINGGGWFETEKAKVFEEATFWNGQNRISKATGSQWNHEELYLTAKGTWVLHAWSQWQGSSSDWRRISDEDAAAWLIQNEHDIPKMLHQAVEATEV